MIGGTYRTYEMDNLTADNNEALAYPPQGKKPYATPRLEDYGDLRDLTLGGSPLGSGDSGDSGSKYPG
jgi:hypothetical protein